MLALQETNLFFWQKKKIEFRLVYYSCSEIFIDLKLMSGDLLQRVNCSDQTLGVINLFLKNKKHTVLISIINYYCE